MAGTIVRSRIEAHRGDRDRIDRRQTSKPLGNPPMPGHPALRGSTRVVGGRMKSGAVGDKPTIAAETPNGVTATNHPVLPEGRRADLTIGNRRSGIATSLRQASNRAMISDLVARTTAKAQPPGGKMTTRPNPDLPPAAEDRAVNISIGMTDIAPRRVATPIRTVSQRLLNLVMPGPHAVHDANNRRVTAL